MHQHRQLIIDHDSFFQQCLVKDGVTIDMTTPSHKNQFNANPHMYLFLMLCLLVFLPACATEPVVPPTLIPVANTPVIAAPIVDEVVQSDDGVVETAVSISTTPVHTNTPSPPTPEGEGINPQDAEQLWVPNAGPELSLEGRPPPMKVPLSLNPDDHYWLIRPIPSGSRNYDLEWYPFGNDVLRSDIGAYRIHHGLDFPNETGTPILAADAGTVVHAGVLPSPRNGVNYYGNTVVILHDWQWEGEDVYTLYAHTLELFVTVGERVEQGQLIAGVGSSGEVSGPHLHFEVRVGVNAYGAARNPALWLAPFGGWGTIAGRIVDKNGRYIAGANIIVKPLNVDTAVREQRSYYASVAHDDVWQENFVIADLPAGEYEVLITSIDNIQYKREVEVFQGQTSFMVVSTNFEFNPTPTRPPSPTPEPKQDP
ncbi:MAG: peptidoglycan DD-metalloendopeptidase family protein [Chloroflexi bacterium]|nr:peptidoglycan DD-metalloendopeptidase family protein [Chloroflexota bacterium]